MLAQRQLYHGRYLDSLATAVNLRDYEDILGKKKIHSLIALAAIYSGAWGQCSKAFTQLEGVEQEQVASLMESNDLNDE